VRHPYGRIVAATLLGVMLGGMAQARTPVGPDQEPVASVVHLLEESGYHYTKETSWLWSVPFIGTNMPRVSVWIMANDEETIIESVIAHRDQVVRLPEAVRQRLIRTEERAGLALLIDDDGNYVARSRLVSEDLEALVFQSSVRAIVAATDAAYAPIKGFVSDQAAPKTAGVTKTSGMPPGASTRLALLRGKASVSFNPARWKETRSAELGKRTFQLANGGGFAMVVAEGIEISIDDLRDRALANMRETASDIQVVHEQRRHVNGTDVLSLQTNVTVQGVAFTYLGYYYGGPSGTVQVVTYAERAAFEDYQRDFEAFLDGFRVGR
jgi:hypothetical protein